MTNFDEDTLENIMMTGLRAKFQNKRMQKHCLLDQSVLPSAVNTNTMVKAVCWLRVGGKNLRIGQGKTNWELSLHRSGRELCHQMYKVYCFMKDCLES